MTAEHRGRAGSLAVLVAVGAVAFNLRPAITSVGPVLTAIERSTGMPGAEAGLLTTMPVLAFGLCSLLVPSLARRFGIEATVAASLGLLVVGLLVRSAPTVELLFLGTAAVGVAIAVANVLVPALIKRDFHLRAGLATGVYSVTLSAGAALAAGVTVPLVHATGAGWRGGLALWAGPAAACLLVWLVTLRGAHHDIAAVHVSARLWRDPVAWQVTIFMGLQSLGYYALVAWIPTIFQQHGVHPAAAGWLLSLAGFASLPAAFGAPVLASTAGRRRAAVCATVVLNGAALGGLLWAPVSGELAWMILLGLAQGTAISLALSFIIVRAPSAQRSAELSGMAQTVGYLLASVGPITLGALRDATGSWIVPLVVMLAVLVPQLACGLGASRSRMVGDGRDSASRPRSGATTTSPGMTRIDGGSRQ